MREIRVLVLVLVTCFASGQTINPDTLDPNIRLPFDTGVAIPESTEYLGFCGADFSNWLIQIADALPSHRAENSACYLKEAKEQPIQELINDFDYAMTAAGYGLAYTKPVTDEVFAGVAVKTTSQIWISGSYQLILLHMFGDTPTPFLATHVGLIIDVAESEIDTFAPVSTIAFDPAIATPEGLNINEGSSCERSYQNTLGFIASMNRNTEHLTDYRCYMLYTNDWRGKAGEMIANLTSANYSGATYTADHLPVIYQEWQRQSGQTTLTFYFAEAKTGLGLYFVVIKHD